MTLHELAMNWIDFLQQQGARQDMRDFGDLKSELESARSSTVIAPLTDLGVIEVSGEDAKSFLHNLLTNDINGLRQDTACLAGLCTPKGRLLATMTIWLEEQSLQLALSADVLATVQKKLAMYVLRSKVKVSDATQKYALIGLSGPKATLALASLGLDTERKSKLGKFEGGVAIHLGGDRYLVALSANSAQDIWTQLTKTATPVGQEAWHWLEIVAGIPRITAKTQEEFVPQMLNYELVGGVSFTKGCYPGQEIVARSQYLGKIKRHMYRVAMEGDTSELQAGATLFSSAADDQPCGMVVQSAYSPLGGAEALVVLPSNCFEAGDLHLGSREGPALRFLPLPYQHQDASQAS